MFTSLQRTIGRKILGNLCNEVQNSVCLVNVYRAGEWTGTLAGMLGAAGTEVQRWEAWPLTNSVRAILVLGADVGGTECCVWLLHPLEKEQNEK